MQRDERIGLTLLIVFLLFSGLLCAVTTNGGQAVGNIFANIASYDAPPNPAAEAQFETIKQSFSNSYWVIGAVAVLAAFLSLIAIVLYILIRRRVPRSWSLFLLLTGLAASIFIFVAQSIEVAIAAVPLPQVPFASATHDSLFYEASVLDWLGKVGAVLALFGLLLLVWSLAYQRAINSQASSA